MKLALILLLLIPACYCSSVTTVCDHSETYLSAGIYLTDEDFQEFVKSHPEDKDGIAGALKVKECSHKFTEKERNDYARTLATVMGECPDDTKDSSR